MAKIIYRCPVCGHDLTDAVVFDAYAGGESMPTTGVIFCNGCGSEFNVRYEWDISLASIKFSSGKTPAPSFLKPLIQDT